MRKLIPVALLVGAVLACSPAGAGIVVAVDKGSQTMTVDVDGKRLHTWPVSTGRRGHTTPSGRFAVRSLDEHHRSATYDDAPMPFSVFFTRYGHAIHGTTAERHLGRTASHGCVRLAIRNARTLFSLVTRHGPRNTVVVVR